jgi:hypothetical protein
MSFTFYISGRCSIELPTWPSNNYLQSLTTRQYNFAGTNTIPSRITSAIGYSPSCISTKILYTFLISMLVYYVFRPSHFPKTDHIVSAEEWVLGNLSGSLFSFIYHCLSLLDLKSLRIIYIIYIIYYINIYFKKRLILRRNFNSKTRKKHSRVSQLIDMDG